MKVNINGTWYDSDVTPIQIQLTQSDKSNISHMSPYAMNYISFPDSMHWEQARETLGIVPNDDNPDETLFFQVTQKIDYICDVCSQNLTEEESTMFDGMCETCHEHIGTCSSDRKGH